MPDAELISALIGQIYDAALEPSLWPAVLGQLASYVGGSAASLYAKDMTAKSVDIYYDDGGLDPAWIERYRNEYIRYDPSTVRQFFAEAGQCVATADIMPYPEFLGTKFSAEWAQPQYLVDGLTAVLEKSAPRLTMFTVFRERGDGVTDSIARGRMNSLIPHVRRAALVTETLANSAHQAASLAETLDALGTSVFLLDAEGRIVHANTAGRAVLETGVVFHRSVSRLSAIDPEAERALTSLLSSLNDGVPAASVTIPIAASDGKVHVACAMPLGSRAVDTGLPRSAVLAIFLRPAALGAIAAPEALARAYKLTPSELRVLLAIVEIGGAPEVADALGVAESTVKFHLRRLFAKTDARRQADLVKLVAGFSSPTTG